MNFNRKKKKGFTIVELVIVIAVIGVLAAILIPTFVGLVEKAHVAADNTLVRELNNALALDLAETGETKHENMTYALEATDRYGFNVAKIDAKASKNKILWDSENGVFCYLKDGELEYVPNSVQENKKLSKTSYKLWIISNDVDATYSTYLYQSTKKTFTTSKGIDVGNEDVTSITYEHTSGDAQEYVIIRTNGGELTIQAPNDDVHHYGYADSVNVIDVATSSYHEKGEVKFLEVAAGHVVLEAEAQVSAFHFTATGEGANAKFENEDGKTISIDISNLPAEKLPEFSRDAVTIAENGTYVAEVKTDSTEYIWLFGNGIKEQMVVSTTQGHDGAIAENGTLKQTEETGCEDGSVAEQIANPANRNSNGELVASDGVTLVTPENAVVEEVASKEDVQIGATLFAGGSGTKNDPWMIVDYDTMQNVTYTSWYYYAYGSYWGYWGFDQLGWSDACAFANSKDVTKYGYYKVKDGIAVIDCKQDGRNWNSVKISGEFDGNGVQFINCDKPLFYWNMGSSEGKIGNFTLNVYNVGTGWNSAVMYYQIQDLTLHDINVHGYIEGATNVSGFVSQIASSTVLTLDNCKSDITIVAISGCASAFISHATSADNRIYFNNGTKYTGNMSAESLDKCCYAGGNYAQGQYVFVFDESSARSDITWRGGNGRYEYTVEGKRSVLSTATGTMPTNIGDSFSVVKVEGATKATVALIVSPNLKPDDTHAQDWGCMTATYQSEAAEIDGSFTSDEIKYFTIRVNADGVSETGVHGNYFDIVESRYGHTVGANTTVKITQYDVNGNILLITTFNFGDKEGIWNSYYGN